jgi:hypothetical protein
MEKMIFSTLNLKNSLFTNLIGRSFDELRIYWIDYKNGKFYLWLEFYPHPYLYFICVDHSLNIIQLSEGVDNTSTETQAEYYEYDYSSSISTLKKISLAFSIKNLENIYFHFDSHFILIERSSLLNGCTD